MADITIREGDTLEVDYNLENTGDGSGTFDPRLLVQGVQEDQDTGITLDPAQTATGTLQWPTESGDAVTDALAEALTDDTSDSITVTVESAIPDSELDHLWYAPNVSSIDPWADEIGSENASIIGAPQLAPNGINSTQTVDYDGTDDGHATANPLANGTSAEHTAVAVVSADTISEGVIYNNGQDNSTDGYRVGINAGPGDEWNFISNGQDNIAGGTVQADTAYVIVVSYDGSSVIVDVNGTEVINGTVTTPIAPTTNFTIGYVPGLGRYFDGDVGAVGHESGFGDASRRDELTNSFADAFGITI